MRSRWQKLESEWYTSFIVNTEHQILSPIKGTAQSELHTSVKRCRNYKYGTVKRCRIYKCTPFSFFLAFNRDRSYGSALTVSLILYMAVTSK